MVEKLGSSVDELKTKQAAGRIEDLNQNMITKNEYDYRAPTQDKDRILAADVDEDGVAELKQRALKHAIDGE